MRSLAIERVLLPFLTIDVLRQRDSLSVTPSTPRLSLSESRVCMSSLTVSLSVSVCLCLSVCMCQRVHTCVCNSPSLSVCVYVPVSACAQVRVRVSHELLKRSQTATCLGVRQPLRHNQPTTVDSHSCTDHHQPIPMSGNDGCKDAFEPSAFPDFYATLPVGDADADGTARLF